MTEKERIDAFLTAFKEVENYVVSLSGNDAYVSFSRALNHAFYSKLNPILSDNDNYYFLKSAADVRNILSHENDVCVPSENFLTRFLKLRDSLLHPLSCYDIATKIVFTCKLNTKLSRLTKDMEYYSLSHVPIVDDKNIVIGVFSRSTIFDYLSMNESFVFSDDIIVNDFKEFLPIDEHLSETYVFVSKYAKVDELYSMFGKKKLHQKEVRLLLVTKNGRRDEPLLGVVTPLDLAKNSI